MKIGLVVCGAVTAAHLPLHLSWIRHNHAGVVDSVILTQSAQRFVTSTAVHTVLGAHVVEDTWESFEQKDGHHVRFGEEHDVILVYPATVDYMSRLVRLSFSTPSVAAIACGTAKIVVCPTMPPGIDIHPLYQRIHKELAALPRMEIIPPVEGQSLASGRQSFVPPPIWKIWDKILEVGK